MRALKTCAVLTENLDEKWRTKMAAPVHKIIIHSIQNNNTKSITFVILSSLLFNLFFWKETIYQFIFQKHHQ